MQRIIAGAANCRKQWYSLLRFHDPYRFSDRQSTISLGRPAKGFVTYVMAACLLPAVALLVIRRSLHARRRPSAMAGIGLDFQCRPARENCPYLAACLRTRSAHARRSEPHPV